MCFCSGFLFFGLGLVDFVLFVDFVFFFFFCVFFGVAGYMRNERDCYGVYGWFVVGLVIAVAFEAVRCGFLLVLFLIFLYVFL